MFDLYELLMGVERITEEFEVMMKDKRYDKELVFMGLLFNISTSLACISKHLEDINKNN